MIQVDGKMLELDPVADACLDASTYRSLGDRPELKVSGDSNNSLLRFDLKSVPEGARVESAVLRFVVARKYVRPMTSESAVFGRMFGLVIGDGGGTTTKDAKSTKKCNSTNASTR